MPQPGAASRVVLACLWIPVGLVMIGVPAWLAVSRWDVLLSSHPALPATVLGCALAGLVAVAWAVATLAVGDRHDTVGDPEHPRYRTPAQRRQRARVRLALGVPALVLCLLVVAWLGYVRPLPAAPAAIAALRDNSRVKVAQRLTWYELIPDRRTSTGDRVKPTTGLVFLPGARVDARAYARLLRPVAAAGYLVIVLKEPFGIAWPDSDHAARAVSFHPEIRYWALGGHSLGGVAAAAFADRHQQVSGLVLYASYPAAPLARRDLATRSIFGDADALTTPADIRATRPRLPRNTRYQVVHGAVHSYFGDYGEQPGDGVPRISRSAAQAQIVSGTITLLASLTPPRRAK